MQYFLIRKSALHEFPSPLKCPDLFFSDQEIPHSAYGHGKIVSANKSRAHQSDNHFPNRSWAYHFVSKLPIIRFLEFINAKNISLYVVLVVLLRLQMSSSNNYTLIHC